MLGNPWALLWLLLAAPIVWLYRRRAAMPEVRVATAALWEQALAEERFRAWWLPRRHAVSLTAQLVILVTAVVALTEPRLSPPGTTILIIDNSASMNATDVEPSRFGVAKQYARRWIDALPAADRVGILVGGAPVQVVCAPTGDRRRLRDAVETLAPGNGGAQVSGAVAVARSMFDGRGVGRIVVLTDACFPEALSLAADDDVDFYIVGTSARNIAVHRVAARRHPGQPEVAQVLVDVAQYSDGPLSEVPLELRFDGKTLDAEPAETVAGPRRIELYELTTAEPGMITAVVETGDALPADNRGGAVIPPSGILRVIDWLSEPAFRAEGERLGEAAPSFPANESDLRVPPHVGTPVEQWPLPRGRFRMWLLFGATVLTMLVSEWCLYQRRWIS